MISYGFDDKSSADNARSEKKKEVERLLAIKRKKVIVFVFWGKVRTNIRKQKDT